MLVDKQLGYENNSNLANNVEIDEGYRQKKKMIALRPFLVFSLFLCCCFLIKLSPFLNTLGLITVKLCVHFIHGPALRSFIFVSNFKIPPLKTIYNNFNLLYLIFHNSVTNVLPF